MTSASNSQRKTTGLLWAPSVPDGWRVLPLKYVISFSTGWTPPTGDAEAYAGENLWANISDLGEKVIYDTAKRLSDEAIKRHGIAASPAGSLLFSFKLSIGQVSFAGRELYTNEAIATFSPVEGLDLRFAFYAFPEMIVRNASENIYGAKMLNQQLINSAMVVLPPLPEQTTVAAFLDRETGKIDALVEEQRRLIELLKEKRQAVISHAVTKGLDPNAKMKPSGVEWLGDVPEHWEVVSVRRIARSVQTGRTPTTEVPDVDAGDLPWYTPGDFRAELRLAGASKGITIGSVDRGEANLFPAGSVLVVSIGATLGKVGLAEKQCSANQQINAVVPSARVDAEFLTWSLSAKVDVMRYLANASTIGIMNQEKTKEIALALPPLEEQQAICRYLASSVARLAALEEAALGAIALLQERRSALIAAAVTGKIDVQEFAEAETAAA